MQPQCPRNDALPAQNGFLEHGVDTDWITQARIHMHSCMHAPAPKAGLECVSSLTGLPRPVPPLAMQTQKLPAVPPLAMQSLEHVSRRLSLPLSSDDLVLVLDCLRFLLLCCLRRFFLSLSLSSSDSSEVGGLISVVIILSVLRCHVFRLVCLCGSLGLGSSNSFFFCRVGGRRCPSCP